MVGSNTPQDNSAHDQLLLAALSPPAAASGEPRLGLPAPPPCMLHNIIRE